jgi:hypothetical protein
MLVALGWVALGLAVAVGGWRMDRLEKMNIEPWSAPGLVPGVLGVLMVVFGAMLAWRERRGATRRPDREGRSDVEAVPAGSAPARIAAVLALTGVFVFGSLGRGLPFVATSTLLVLAWIAMLRWPSWRAEGRGARGLAGAAAIAFVACVAIATLFERVFLVRLP